MSMVKVSIIVPVYNAENCLERCLESLVNQTLKEIEIILVDDGSKDKSPMLCDKAAQQDSRIKVIHKNNEGAGKARNAGLKLATGEYIGFVDCDDFVELNMYETFYNTAEGYNSDLIMSGVLFVGGSMFREEGNRIEKNYFDEDTHFETADEINYLKLGIIGALPGEKEDSRYGMSVWKNLMRRDIIINNGLYFESEREMLSEDALFMVDYISCINKATGINGAFYNYIRNEGSISKSYKKDRFFKGEVFVHQVEKRFNKDMTKEMYEPYIDRFWQSFCRVVCAQEIMYAKENKIKYSELRKRLVQVCTHQKTKEVLKRYPLSKLPLKQSLFAFAMKYKMYYLQTKMVGLRNR